MSHPLNNIRTALGGPRYEYYNFQYTNPSDGNVPAVRDFSLNSELLSHPDNWLANIQRFEIDTRGMPLTNNNIPLNQWEIALGYNTGAVSKPNKLPTTSMSTKQLQKKQIIPIKNRKTISNGWNYFSSVVQQYQPQNTNVYTYILTPSLLQAYANGSLVTSIPITATQLISSTTYLFTLQESTIQIYDYSLNLYSTVIFTAKQIALVNGTQDFIATDGNSITFFTNSGNTWTAGLVYNTLQPYEIAAIACDGISIFATDVVGFYYKWEFISANPIATGNTGIYRYNKLSSNSNLTASGTVPTTVPNILATNSNVYVLIPSESELIAGPTTTATVLAGAWSDGTLYSANGANILTAPISGGVPGSWTTATPAIPFQTQAIGASYVSGSNQGCVYMYDTSKLYCYDEYHGLGVGTGLPVFVANFPPNVVSIDCLSDNTMIIVDNVGDVQKTNEPVSQRQFLLDTGTYGINYNIDGNISPSFQTTNLTIPAEQNRITTNGQYYYWWNPAGNVVTVTSQAGVVISTITPTASIEQLSSVNGGTIIVGLDTDGNVEILSTVVEGTITPTIGETIDFAVLIDDETVMVNFAVPSATIKLYDIANPASPTLLTTFTSAEGIPNNIISMTYIPPNYSTLYGAFAVTTGNGGTTPNTLFIFEFGSGLASISQLYLAAGVVGSSVLSSNASTLEFYLYAQDTGQLYSYPLPLIGSGVVEYTLPASGFILPQPSFNYTYVSLTSETVTAKFEDGDMVTPVVPLSITADRTSNFLYGCDTTKVYMGTLTDTTITWVSSNTESYTALSAFIRTNSATTSNVINQLSTVDFTPTYSQTYATQPNFILSAPTTSVYANFGTNQVLRINLQNGQQSFTQFTQSPIIGYSNNILSPVPNIPYPLYQYQDFLNQINAAIADCVAQLIDADIGFTDATAPLIYFDYTSKIFKIVATDSYLSQNIVLDFNLKLYQRFLFPTQIDINNPLATLDGYPWQQIQFVNYGTNVSVTTVAAQNPTVTYITMTSGSVLALWNDVTTIIVQSDHLPILGDKSGSSNVVNQVTDVTPDFGSITPGETIIYIPTTLRQYNLTTMGQSFAQIDIKFSYMTKDGTIYPMLLVPGGYFSVKFQFNLL